MKYDRWWDSVTKEYTIRELDINDLNEIENLLRSNPTLWHKNNLLTPNEQDMYMLNYEKKFQDKLRWKSFGAFLDGKLIMENSGYFPLKFNIWYHTSLRHKGNNNSIFSGNFQRYLFADCFLPLIKHGEDLKKFSFYSMRSITHQKVINRMWDRAKPNSPLFRYDYYIDQYIKKGSLNNLSTIGIFPEGPFPVDIVINLHCLKNQYRSEILKCHQ